MTVLSSKGFKALIKPQQVRLWSLQFLLWIGFIKDRMLKLSQNGYFSPSLARSMKGFLCYSLWETGKLLEVKLTKVLAPAPSNWVALEFLTLQHVHAEPPAIHQLQFRSTGSRGGFCLWISAQISCNSLYLSICLSSIGDSTSAHNLTSLIDLARVVGFCLFSFLLVVKTK